MSGRRLLGEMTREEIVAAAPDATVVLPVGAFEQHGPHLPVLVDDLVVDTLADRAAAIAEAVGQLPGHAGGFETSLMLSLRPDLVDRQLYPSAGGFRSGPVAGEPYFEQRSGLWENAGGYSEPPVRASGEAGERFLGVAAEAIARALVNFHRDEA